MKSDTSAPARPAADIPPDSTSPALTRIVVAATLVAAALRLFRLGHQSLWIDEVFSWQAAGGNQVLGVRELLENVHGPLYALMLHAWMRVAGQSEWALRAPSALAGVLMVPAIAQLARRWLGREAVAPAAWLAATSPFLVWYGQEVRNYAWLLLWAVVSVSALLELRRAPSARAVAQVLGATAAGLLTNWSFALLLPFHLRLWLGGEPATRAYRARALAGAAVVLALLAAPFVPRVAATWDFRRLQPQHATAAGEALRGSTTFHVAAVPFAFHSFAVGFTLGPSLRELHARPAAEAVRAHAPELAATAAVFGFLGALAVLALSRRRKLADTLLWLVAPVVLVSYFAAHNFKVFNPRYLAVGLPCLLLGVAAALADLRPATRRLAAGAIAALWAISLYHHYFVPGYGREDYRGALTSVRAGFAPGEQVLAVGSPDPVEFYGKGLRVEPWWLGFAADSSRMALRFEQAASHAHGTWVVLSRHEDLDPADHFARWLDTRYPGATRSSFEGVRVWHVPPQQQE